MDPKPPPFTRRGTEEQRIEVSADEILNAIAEGRDVDVLYAIINGDVDTRRIVDFDFPKVKKLRGRLKKGNDSKFIIPGNIEIRFSEIRGDTRFYSVKLDTKVSFRKTTFYGEVDFAYTDFTTNADFRYAQFHMFAIFWSTKFAASADFRNAEFRAVDFNSAKFNGRAYFAFTKFNMSAIFNHTMFDRDADFHLVKFCRGAGFLNAEFDGKIDFGSAEFGTTASFDGAMTRHLANFSDTEFRENTVFAGLWNSTLGQIGRLRRTVTDFSFNTENIMDASSNPYLKRYIDDEQWIASWRQRSWWRKVLFVFWELTSHCGRSFGLWLFWSFALAVAFGFLYKGHIDIGSVKNWYTPFYFSVVTFTTLGFGDVTPIDWLGQLWITLEVVCGYLMLGRLISIFANKFARRS